MEADAYSVGLTRDMLILLGDVEEIACVTAMLMLGLVGRIESSAMRPPVSLRWCFAGVCALANTPHGNATYHYLFNNIKKRNAS
jgi:hypothetical protein